MWANSSIIPPVKCHYILFIQQFKSPAPRHRSSHALILASQKPEKMSLSSKVSLTPKPKPSVYHTILLPIKRKNYTFSQTINKHQRQRYFIKTKWWMCIYRIFIHYSLILLVFLIHIFKVLLTLHLLNIFKKAKNETKIFATKWQSLICLIFNSPLRNLLIIDKPKEKWAKDLKSILNTEISSNLAKMKRPK